MSAAVQDERFILTANKLRGHIILAFASDGKESVQICLSGGNSRWA
jgi:hypothetical protein